MSDPIRLRDPRAGASPELRDLLAAGRSELPDAKRLGAIAGRLGVVSPLPGRIDALAHGGTAKWLATGATKIGVAALVVGVGTAAAVAVRGHPAPKATPEVLATSVAATPTTGAPPSSDEAPDPTVAAPTPLPSGSMHPGPTARVRVVTSATPTATAPASTGSESPLQHPPGWAPSTWGSSVSPAPPAPPSDSPSLALERALRDERSSDRLDEQRDVVIIEALVRLGRMAEARERAARFLRIFPASAHHREVAELVGFDPGRQNR